MAGWARYASPAAWEPDLLLALALGADPVHELLRALNRLGDLPVWAVLVAMVSVTLYVLRGLVAGALVALSVAADLLAALVKLVVERGRPEGALVESLFGPDNYAFPSGHVVRAVAFAAVVVWLLAPVRIRLRLALVGALGAGLLMGYARVALGVHWPTDALGGLLLGSGWFAATTLMATRPRGRRSRV